VRPADYRADARTALMAAPAGSVARETPAEVVLDDISYAYPTGVQALSGLSLDIPQGKNIGVIGPSGCGKSTLLFLLAGIYQPQAGTIRWREQSDVEAAETEHRHRLAMVFQGDTLLPWRTVTGNVELFAQFQHGLDKQAVRKRTSQLIDLAALHGFEDTYPYQLSGGMRRRVAFLQAAAASPEILLLDEPFSALDEPTRIGIHQDVFSILRELKTTMVLVTHDLAETLSLCDEVVILTNRPGKVHSRHVVPFGDERNMLSLRHEPEFLELYGALWEDLSQQILRTPSTPRASGSPH
jgi:NitT/TauT family transport system ATP-binding protein